MDRKSDAAVHVPETAPAPQWKAKRQHERIVLEVPLLVSLGEGKFISGRIVDISEGGLVATLHVLCPVDQVVELQFALSPGGAPMHIRSLTKYSSEVRHGFEFLKLAPQQREAIAQLVASKTKRVAPLETTTPRSQPYKFGGGHAPGCVCPVCTRAGGAHSSDCLCEACGMYGGEHSQDCRCAICRVPGGKHAADCRCPRCGVVG
jgi:hypothetical protein